MIKKEEKHYYFVVEKITTTRIRAAAPYEDIARRRVLKKFESGEITIKDDETTKFKIKRA